MMDKWLTKEFKDEFKKKLNRKLEEKRKRQKETNFEKPRYDEIFFDALEILDSL